MTRHQERQAYVAMPSVATSEARCACNSYTASPANRPCKATCAKLFVTHRWSSRAAHWLLLFLSRIAHCHHQWCWTGCHWDSRSGISPRPRKGQRWVSVRSSRLGAHDASAYDSCNMTAMACGHHCPCACPSTNRTHAKALASPRTKRCWWVPRCQSGARSSEPATRTAGNACVQDVAYASALSCNM